jgi:hypothetical protein
VPTFHCHLAILTKPGGKKERKIEMKMEERRKIENLLTGEISGSQGC